MYDDIDKNITINHKGTTVLCLNPKPNVLGVPSELNANAGFIA
tara:strand:- start:681 stop:809 length:129 start_codon:yes stop_codon:yes gene_type:complete